MTNNKPETAVNTQPRPTPVEYINLFKEFKARFQQMMQLIKNNTLSKHPAPQADADQSLRPEQPKNS